VAAAGALEDVPESQLRRVMETNFFGVLELTRALLPTFRAQGRGHIVIVSSEAAFMGQPTNSIYCASKWAVEGWAEAVAYELEPFGIDIILVETGPYRMRSGTAPHAW
jgi:short-subunit dehydrogenase